MVKDLSKMPLPKLDDLFTTEEERVNASLEKVVDIKISDIDDFPDHPFKVIDDDEMEKMKNSIIDNKVIIISCSFFKTIISPTYLLYTRINPTIWNSIPLGQ